MPTHHFVASGPGRGSPALVSMRVSMFEPSRFARMTRMPSRSDQYSFPDFFSIWICLGVNVLPGGTIVVRFPPSRSERRIEPSFALGFPMLVQYRCPAAMSTARPSGSFLPSSTIVLRSEPSGLAVRTRPPPRSRRKRRPAAPFFLPRVLVEELRVPLMRRVSGVGLWERLARLGAEREEREHHLVLLLRELVDGALARFLEHAVDDGLLEGRRDIGHLKTLHQAGEGIHQMLHEVMDAPGASAQMPLQARAHDAPPNPRSVAHGDVGIGHAQHALLDEIEHLLVERRLEAVARVARQRLVKPDRLAADGGVERHCAFDRRFGRLG